MGNFEKLAIALLLVALHAVGFNELQISKLKTVEKPIGKAIVESKPVPTKNINSNLGIDIIPKGVPRIYGNELGVGYDDISASNQQKADSTIRKLGILDQQISLSGKDLEKYISIASQISCEYCCGVDSIIFSDGKPACSCAHSFAMRGLTKYLIKYHGNEYSNDEILEELGKWKTLFFPSQTTQKAKVLQEKGIDLGYINLASNKYRGVENAI